MLYHIITDNRHPQPQVATTALAAPLQALSDAGAHALLRSQLQVSQELQRAAPPHHLRPGTEAAAPHVPVVQHAAAATHVLQHGLHTGTHQAVGDRMSACALYALWDGLHTIEVDICRRWRQAVQEQLAGQQAVAVVSSLHGSDDLTATTTAARVPVRTSAYVLALLPTVVLLGPLRSLHAHCCSCCFL